MTKRKEKFNKWLKVLQYLAAYLVAAWTFLQFIDWILTRYQISPYWVDILLWFFIGIIPSLVIYLYHQERINQKVLLLREKIIFPTNIVLLIVGLYFGFGTSDLGATTKEVNYFDSNGKIAETIITKEEFRTIIPIYNFASKSKDTTLEWLGSGIAGLLFYDLLQDKSVSPEWGYIDNTTEKVMNASLVAPFYVDGTYNKVNNTFIIETTVRSSKNGTIKSQKTFEGTDFLDLIDSISIYVRGETGMSQENGMQYIDLSVKEFISSSLPALKDFLNGNYEGAIAKDSTFALAYLRNSRRNIIYSQGRYEEQALAEKAYELRDKLPYDFQMEAMAIRYLAYDKFEEAKKVLKMQLEISPQNTFLNGLLYGIYGETKDVDSYFATAQKRFNGSKSEYNLMAIASASLTKGEFERYIDMVNLYSTISPNNNYIFPFKLVPQILSGKYEDAKKTYDKINLVHPDNKNINQVFEEPLSYLPNNQINEKDLKFFEGEFRNEGNEATNTFWVEKNKLLGYYSNQKIQVLIPSTKNKLIRGVPNQVTYEYDFKQDENGKVFAYIRKENYTKNSIFSWAWKLDESIVQAEDYLIKGDYLNAEITYQKAIKSNPNHYYLKDALQHIKYVKEKDSLQLLQQYEKVKGIYSLKDNEKKRKIVIQNGKLMYKRDGLPSKHLLPISETRYMTLSSYRTHYEFIVENGEVVASFAWVYDAEKRAWEDFNPNVNYLLKEK